MPRPPLQENNAPASQENDRTSEGTELMQQAMQRLLAAYNQCTHRVAQTDDRMEQFRSNLRCDALELALNVKRIEQDLQYQYQSTARLKQSLHDDVQERVNGLEERLRHLMDHETHVNQTIVRNAIIHNVLQLRPSLMNNSDIRKVVKALASQLDRSQETSGATQT